MSYTWLPLDNAAKIFPAVTSREHTTVFRLSVILYSRVNYNRLLHAIKVVETRFPYFRVCLKKGFFWYYLEHVKQEVVLAPDDKGICRTFKNTVSENPILYRILVKNNRISVEFSHVLTDGSGGERFLAELLGAYFNDEGIKKETLFETSTCNDFTEEEFEDAYNRYFKSDIPPVIKYTKAFHLPFRLNRKPRFNVMVFQVSLCHIKEKARLLEISITDYLVSVYLYILQEIHNELPRHKHYSRRKILRIQVPVNLRKIYPTRSMRNFSLFVLPEIDLRLGNYSFDEIIKIVHYKMKLETDRKLINKIITRNVRSEKNPFVRGIPLFIKDLILHYKYYSQGANQYGGVITNLGKIELPCDIMERIRYLVFIPPPPNKKLKINCGVIGFDQNLSLSFGNISNSKQLETRFIRFLTAQEIPVKLIKY
jgi:NRPS condensation-like uncharacterized protein